MICISLLVILMLGSVYIFFPKPSGKLQASYDAMLVLGCPTKNDGTPSKRLTDRCDHAIALYRAQTAPVIIVSGAAVDNPYKEADIMETYLKKRLPDAVIQKETHARNTYENLKYTKEAFPYKHLLVITSPPHMRRASFFTKKFYPHGDVTACPSKGTIRDHLSEYTRMWVCLYYEIKLRKK